MCVIIFFSTWNEKLLSFHKKNARNSIHKILKGRKTNNLQGGGGRITQFRTPPTNVFWIPQDGWICNIIQAINFYRQDEEYCHDHKFSGDECNIWKHFIVHGWWFIFKNICAFISPRKKLGPKKSSRENHKWLLNNDLIPIFPKNFSYHCL